ncbi:hypothetical protein ETB97_008327 [Aspergillus alliaceus]|uniref:Proline hydroxylase buaE n=2 Tax=Petromyces alliaceus TaxID=209559 RepID=BUAE_PETAA|nr:uncharacterized protein BDW43DRAFT_274973 [Aspergillus alliaceus]A0A411L030.1 RecName: Full=Proline hydroxylase buaE; AltName: Full=2-oxoglutarate-dependent dioxygenase buaE; AltName: Full=Burnettramic acids biosynthesis cluster protein E [Aspergillus burnettii]KAB8233740.1 hypothetical protein BDW43DRAFT_274973 [Aspergillus alliaceus]KAF5855845.1 hypothetical protein ETB97_008327 [Aspergillus burnettii]QBE85645.1 BuaE [Aspergillus burnettii]
MEVERLDYTDFLNEAPGRQEAFVQHLYAALSRVGFAKITNHPIPESVILQLFAWTKGFFTLPLEHKRKAAHPPQPNPHRGWSCIGQEKLSVIAQGKAVLDLKESFDMGPGDDELYPNIWTDEGDLPGFRAFMEDFYGRCQSLHLQLLSAIARSMQLPDSYFAPLCSQNSSELRLNHYPAVSRHDLTTGTMRISSHTDFGTITLLFQDSVGGLEVEDQTRPGHYMPVAADDCTDIIVNVGDCLQRWTNDRLRSANHRVTLPRGLTHGMVDDRYSIAYFGKPSRDVSVRTLSALLRANEEAKYREEMTAWQYNQSRLLQTY